MWDGAFSPSLRKSIGTVTFVPISRMSQRDWEWLDFDNLREVAANRIANMAMKGKLTGFFRVMIVQKAGPNKHEYLWPVDQQMVEDYGFVEETPDGRAPGAVPLGQAPDFFRYTPDIDSLDGAVLRLDALRLRVARLPRNYMLTLTRLLIFAAAVAGDGNEQPTEEQDNLNDPGYDASTDCIAFILTSMALRYIPEPDIESALDQLVACENQADLDRWYDEWKQYFRGQSQIAAGRGLTTS